MNIVGPPLGKIGIVPPDFKEWNINQALAIFRARKDVEPLYLLHVLRSPNVLVRILAQAAGVRQLNLSLEQCRRVEIPVPPLSLQREFVSRVDSVRDLKERQSTSRDRLGDVFEGLLHSAFQGKI
jgi:type I restriction enzyme S subunit